jgi:indolepyruvate ferredoxin oxidoreductase alpha subunit
MLEPATVAEAYELAAAAFEISERARTPVFLRLTTAVALTHVGAEVSVDLAPALTRDVLLERSIARYTKAGAKICLDQHRELIERLSIAGGVIRAMGLNNLALAGRPGGVGVVAVGPTYAYLAEALAAAGREPNQVSILKTVTTTPFPREEAETLLRYCGAVLVLEELEPFFERELVIAARRIQSDARIVGKLDGTLSRLGEYGVDEIACGFAACGLWPVEGQHVARGPWPVEGQHVARGPWPVGTASFPQATSHTPQAVVPPSPQATSHTPQAVVPPSPQATSHTPQAEPAPRPITVCAGCPHRGTYMAIEAAIKKAGLSKDAVMVTGDIGCTILGMNPPFELIWNEVSMGSSVSLAQGYVHAGVGTPVIATIGDSTFFHGGIPGLLNAVQHRVPLTLVVMDNGWTAMTGMQVNPGTDDAFQAGGRRVDLARILPALGVDRFDVVDPYDLPAMTAVLADGLREPGVKVVLARRECAIQARRRGVTAAIAFDAAKCVLCKRCIKVTGCPALGCSTGDGAEQLGRNRVSGSSGSAGRERITIDETLCNGCGLCAAICPTQALGPSREGGRGLGSKPDSEGFDGRRSGRT